MDKVPAAQTRSPDFRSPALMQKLGTGAGVSNTIAREVEMSESRELIGQPASPSQ